MAQRDKTKEPTFRLWQKRKTLNEIQKEIAKIPGTSTKPSSIHNWVKDWERGRQGTWDPKF